MDKSFKKRMVDFIYPTNRVKRKYLLKNPTETVLASDACKGIVTSKNKDIQRDASWITAQRAVILLTDKNIVCGKWIIPLEDVRSAHLITFSSLLTGKGQVLKIQTKDDKFYQFGMEYNREWTNQSILPMTTEKGEVKYSTFSIILRVLIIGLLIYWIYEKFVKST